MDNRKEEQEKALLLLIDRYNEEREKDRLYFLKYKKNNPDSGLNKEPFLTFYKLFESKTSQIEITDFLYHFGLIRLLNTFHYSHHAERLIHDFEILNIPVPYFVLECQKEVICREERIRSFFENEKFKWSETKREDFYLEIQKEAKFHSFGAKSEREYLEEKFKETIQEVRKVESEIQRRFGYNVDCFFDGDNLKVSASDLNEYFYHSEIASGGCGSYFEVWKALDRFINKKHEIFALRSFLSGVESVNSANNFNKMPMEEVRSHFKQLTEKINLSGEKWMTKNDFEIFLKRSFEGQKDLPKPKINLGKKGKGAIVKLFYEFYYKSYEYQNNRKKDAFVKLLKEAFNTIIFENINNNTFQARVNNYPWN